MHTYISTTLPKRFGSWKSEDFVNKTFITFQTDLGWQCREGWSGAMVLKLSGLRNPKFWFQDFVGYSQWCGKYLFKSLKIGGGDCVNKPWFIAFADLCGANTSTIFNFKLPIKCHQSYNWKEVCTIISQKPVQAHSNTSLVISMEVYHNRT